MYGIEEFRQDVINYVNADRWMADKDVILDLLSKLYDTDITLDDAVKVAQKEIPNPPLVITKELVIDLGNKHGINFSRIIT